MSKEIPVKEAEELASKYGYDQIVILGMKPHDTKKDWSDGWRTTFNKDKGKKDHLGVVAEILMRSFRCFYACMESATAAVNQMREADEKIEEFIDGLPSNS